jgi:archaeosortase A (PGF-CTERM-specific)
MSALPFSESFLAFSGLLLLALAFHSKKASSSWAAVPGWILLGSYFFLNTPHYVELADPVLIIMSAATLPMAIAIAIWEARLIKNGEISESLNWFRGACFWAGMPYLMVEKIPWLNVLAIWFVAGQTVLFMRWTGAGDIQLGETYVNIEGQSIVTWSEWDGNRWFLDTGGAENAFFTDLQLADGTPIGISFVLACTALQSMIVFVGAIVALQTAPWQRRVRALLISLPVIHVLNIFRNAGLVWLHANFIGWEWLTLSMFDFGHSYAAKVVSLGAMFLMALVLFELLPQLHRHILELMGKLMPKKKKRKTQA